MRRLPVPSVPDKEDLIISGFFYNRLQWPCTRYLSLGSLFLIFFDIREEAGEGEELLHQGIHQALRK